MKCILSKWNYYVWKKQFSLFKEFPATFHAVSMIGIPDHDCIAYAVSYKEHHVRSSLCTIGITGEWQVVRLERNRLGRFDEIHSLGMRFTARPLGRGRRAISDICEGLLERNTPLDFTTREVVRETFRWRVRSLPLLVQITFRTLNLFREVGRRPLAHAGESFAFSTVYSLLI